MNDSRRFAALQARLYEFLEQQDDSTLEALAAGELRLTTVQGGPETPPLATNAPSPPRASSDAELSQEVNAPAASGDPLQAASDLRALASSDERRRYLRTSRLTVRDLQRVAKELGRTGYSRLNRDALTELLSEHRPSGATPRAKTVPGNDVRAAARAAQPREPRGSKREVDAATIAARLREADTEREGSTLLREHAFDRDGLLAVAAELRLTRVDRLNHAALEKRILKQAIGARRKFAGLQRW